MSGRRHRFTTGTAISAAIVAALFAVANVTPVFAKMFAEFGSNLPVLTRIVLLPWFPIALGVLPASVVIYTIVADEIDDARRRRLLVIASVFAALGWATCVVAMYLPKTPIMAR